MESCCVKALRGCEIRIAASLAFLHSENSHRRHLCEPMNKLRHGEKRSQRVRSLRFRANFPDLLDRQLLAEWHRVVGIDPLSPATLFG